MLISVVASMPGSEDKELIKDLQVEGSKTEGVKIQSAIERLIEIGYPVQESLVSYFSPEDDLYTFVRKEPLLDSDIAPSSAIVSSRLYLRFRYQDQLTGEPREEEASAPAPEETKR